MPCCQKCSCEPDCQLFGNCCPDKELTPDVQVRYPCVAIDEYYNKRRSINVFTPTNVFYHVIDDCPTIIRSIEYPKCSDPYDLEDYVFVSDRLTGRVYKNKDCAKCNGVEQYAEWDMMTDCPTESEGLTREEWFSYVLKSCAMTPILSDTSVNQAFRCYPVIDQAIKCNSSGTWKDIDLEIQEACESENPRTNAIYYHEYTTLFLRRDTYQNAFCKLCNPLNVREWSDLCVNVLSSITSKTVSTFGLSVLINFIKTKESSLAPQCKPGQIWDPYQNICMPATCPVSSLLQAGKCEDMYKKFPGESYEILFRIESRRIEVTPKALENTHDVITGLINNRYCYQCSSTFVTEDENPGVYYISHIVKATKWCTEAYLIQQIKILAKNPHSYYSNFLSNVTLVPELSVKPRRLIEEGEHYFVNACPNRFRIDQKMTDRCLRIPLTYTKLNVSTNALETERDGSLCLYEYFKIMRSMSHSKHNKDIVFIIILVKTIHILL
ncbi:hypothetical protein ACF0H5_015588 [Mactra antiquata]